MSARLVEGAGSAPFAPDETLGNLVDDVLTVLQGHGVVTDQMCSTSGNITATDTTIPLDDGDAVSRGVIEVGEELIFVTGSQNGQATAPAWGRGFKGTKAKAWPKGTRVTVSPRLSPLHRETCCATGDLRLVAIPVRREERDLPRKQHQRMVRPAA